MTIIPWPAVGRGPRVPGSMAGTIGVFDGVHRGHQALLTELGRSVGDQRLVVTFRENPKKFLFSGYPGDLMTWNEKVQCLADAGVDMVVVIDFSPGFSTMSGRDFFLSLKKSFHFSKLVLGWDFSFGKDSATTAADLGWLANPETRLTILPPVTVEGRVVSSSAVRQAILGGDLGLARIFLGRPYSLPVEGPVRRDSGVWVIPRTAVAKLLPPTGLYPVRVDGQVTELNVESDHLSWESPPGISFREIVFV